ncbi:MAG: hypothetical protein LC791_11765 [Acidobacteria bacterium]|nr:hypothetical protein [Acidobacteriota bacterium]
MVKRLLGFASGVLLLALTSASMTAQQPTSSVDTATITSEVKATIDNYYRLLSEQNMKALPEEIYLIPWVVIGVEGPEADLTKEAAKARFDASLPDPGSWDPRLPILLDISEIRPARPDGRTFPICALRTRRVRPTCCRTSLLHAHQMFWRDRRTINFRIHRIEVATSWPGPVRDRPFCPQRVIRPDPALGRQIAERVALCSSGPRDRRSFRDRASGVVRSDRSLVALGSLLFQQPAIRRGPSSATLKVTGT